MIKVFEMFAGYGGASFGLKKANIPFECVGYSEVDKYAIQCYQQNHNKYLDGYGKNFGDCSKIDTKGLPDFDLLTGGFPCQDVSIAGKRDLNKGRTNLYEEILRIVKDKKPKYILLENVKGLLSMKVNERALHLKIVNDLKKLGYGVCWKVLNSKDYGIPQNRERIWFVCKLGGWDFMEFQFPYKEKLKIFLKDVLEKEVDKRYYLSEKQINKIKERNENFDMKGNRFLSSDKEYFSGLTCNQTQNDILMISNSSPREFGFKEFSPALCARDYKEPKLVLSQKTRDINQAINTAQEIANKENKPIQLDLMHLQHGEIRPLSSYIPQDFDIHRCLQSGEPKEVLIEPRVDYRHPFPNSKGYKNISPSIKSSQGSGNQIILNSIRRLTPKECFRLMGFLDDEINLDGLSDTQKYRLAGNGWCIQTVSKIFYQMFKNTNYLNSAGNR